VGKERESDHASTTIDRFGLRSRCAKGRDARRSLRAVFSFSNIVRNASVILNKQWFLCVIGFFCAFYRL